MPAPNRAKTEHTGRIRGLYAIADTGVLRDAELVTAVERAIAGGAALVQYRDKGRNAGKRRRQAGALADLCRARRVPFIVNDDPELARQVTADGAHLGREDGDIAEARRLLGGHAIIGVSCYDDLRRAIAAAAAGADYVAFGGFFPSPTKPGTLPAGPRLLRRAKGRLHIPIVAIGGITPDNGRPLIASGADALAAISGVFRQPDVRAAAERYARLFKGTE